MIQQCMQMMSQMNGMTLAPARSAGVGSGMMGGGAVNGTPMLIWTSPWYWFGWVIILALVVLLIAAVVWMIRATRRQAVGPETPLSILQRRLALGEVSLEQFETIKRQLV